MNFYFLKQGIFMKKIELDLNNENKQNDIVIQHNHLIEARYRLTLQEKRLMCWLVSQVKQADEDFKEHELSIKEFADLIEVKGDHLYKTLDDIAHKLMQKVITIKAIEKKGFVKAALLGGVKYYEGQGIIKLSFHPYLKPYMLQLKSKFTQIHLGELLGLKSIHAIRIYELLKQYEILGDRKITLNNLKLFCGLEEQKYKRFNDFKKDVLERTKKEINNKTDIYIDYIPIKESRKIVAIEWSIKKKNPLQEEKLKLIQKELRSQSALIEALMEYGFSRAMAKRLTNNHDETVIKNALNAVDIQVSKGQAKNPKSMLQTAIQEKWHPDIFKKKSKAA
jgi:plasmid replication initiation protein